MQNRVHKNIEEIKSILRDEGFGKLANEINANNIEEKLKFKLTSSGEDMSICVDIYVDGTHITEFINTDMTFEDLLKI